MNDALTTLTLILAAYPEEKAKRTTPSSLVARVLDELGWAAPPGAAAAIDAAIGLLAEVRLLEPSSGLPSNRGQAAVRGFLGSSGRTKWGSKNGSTGIRDLHLPRKLLGLPPPPTKGRQQWLLAHWLSEGHDLGIAPYTSLTAAGDRLVWLALARLEPGDLTEEIDKSFCARALSVLLYRQLAGCKPPRSARLSAKHLAASALGHLHGLGRPFDGKDARALTYRTWLASNSPVSISVHEAGVDTGPSPVHPAKEPPETLNGDVRDVFVGDVFEAARACEPWAPGSPDVYISDVWDRLISTRPLPGLDFDGFKRRLAEAARDGRIILSEGQLVAAMDAERRARSEVELGPHARRHLLRTQ